ncbi:Pentatricopeptide repeat-containing protein, chloroplastic [Glycine soja]
MAQPYPLCPSPSASSFSFHSRIPFFTIVPSHSKTLLHAPRFSLQPVNTLQDAKLDDPDAKSPSLSKNSIWVNPRSPRAKHLQKNSPHARSSSLTKLAKSLDSCNPTEQHVSEILNVLRDNVSERDAVFILNTMVNPNTALLALKYFQPKINPAKHVVLYNVTLKVLREVKDFEGAEKLFDEMLQRGVEPNLITFSTIISSASVCSLPDKAIKWFEKMPSFGVEPDASVGSFMIHAYAHSGKADMALELYDRAKAEKWRVDTVAFSVLIKMCGMLENFDGCLSVYNDMKVLGAKPNMVTYNTLLYAMGRAKRALDAKAIYEEMISNGFSPNWPTHAALLQAYCKARFCEDALGVYKEMKKKGMDVNLFLYNLLFDMCADVGCMDEAVEIFEDMKSSGTCQPDNFTYSCLINMYSSHLKRTDSLESSNPWEQQVSTILKGIGDMVSEGDVIFILNKMVNPNTASFVLRYFLNKINFTTDKELILYNATLNLFRKSRDFEGAEKLFDEMLQRGVKPNNFTFSTMVNCANKPVELFEKMSGFGYEPDGITCSAMVYAYALSNNVDKAVSLYDRAIAEKWCLDAAAFSALIKMYSMAGNYDRCLKIYQEMKVLGVKPNVVTYNTLLGAMLKAEKHRQAKAIYKEMRSNGVSPDFITYACLLEVYTIAHYSEDALGVYKEMKGNGMDMTADLYNKLLAMYADMGYIDRAVEIFYEMNSSGTCQPDSWTFASLIAIYSRSGKVSEAEGMLNEMIQSGFQPTIFVLTSLSFLLCCSSSSFPPHPPSSSSFHYRQKITNANSVPSYSSRHFKLPNFSSSHQPKTLLQDAKLDDPNAKSSPLSKTSIWVNPKSPRAKHLWKNSYHARSSSLTKLAKSLDSCNPTQEHVSEILKVLGDSVLEPDAVFILNSMVNPYTALLAVEYFKQKVKSVRHVILYNVTLKLFRKVKDFEGAEKLFDEMLHRGVNPNLITFSTMISCASVCSLPHKAVKWFEMMPSFGCEPDNNVCSSMIYAYTRTGNTDMALRLYDRAKAGKWHVDTAVFSGLIKMYGVSGNYVGCLNVYNDMKVLGAKPNLTTYNALLYAMGRAKRARDAKAIYGEMISNGLSPNWPTYAALLQAYCRARFNRDALNVYKEMNEKGKDLDILLYNMLFDMCANVGCVDEAVKIFEHMKSSGTCPPDSFTYASLINMYSSIGKILEMEAMFNEMMESGFEPNIIVLTSLVHCYGKAKRTDDVVKIFNQLMDLGISPDGRFCDCLLYAMTQVPKEELGKLSGCVEKANPKLGSVLRYIMEKQEGGGDFRTEASELFNSTEADVKKSMCNCLIDLCVSLDVPDRARDLLDLGLTLEIYPDIQSRSQAKWSLHLKRLSVGAALTALSVWISDLSKALELGEELPPLLGINTGGGKHRFSDKVLPTVFESYLKELKAPFHKDANKAGWFLATSEAATSWLQSRGSTVALPL